MKPKRKRSADAARATEGRATASSDPARAKAESAASSADPARAKAESAVASSDRAREKAESAPVTSAAATKISASVGIVAAMVLATLINIFVARHYRRWDVTRGGLYTLSDATLSTLHDIGDPVRIQVLLPGGDALTLSVAHLLDGYRSETSHLDVSFLDPDRHPADFLALAQRYGIDVDRDEGRVIVGAAAIVSRGDRHEIVRQQDLIEVDDADDLRRRPRLEQAFTGAIRAVVSTDHPKACFATGHGEAPSSPLRGHLLRSGYEVQGIEAGHAGEAASLDGCTVLVIAGPTEPFPAADVARFKTYLDKGGSVFVAIGPLPDNSDRGYLDLGLGDLLGSAGLALDRDFVFELSAEHRSVRGRGETFAPLPRQHAINQRFLRGEGRSVFPPVITVASSLTATGAGAAATVPLLVTTDQAFGMVDFFAWAKTGGAAVPTAADKNGPLTVAFASELPKVAGSTAAHGGRMVTVGSASVVQGENWQSEELRGTVIFVESALAWLTARPPILDIPNKPAFTAGLHVSDEWLAGAFRYVVIYVPLASLLLGIAVYLRRKSTERRKPVGAGGS